MVQFFGDPPGKACTAVHNEFTAVIEQDGAWFIAFCPEVPGANGQGTTREESLASLREAIKLILEDSAQPRSGDSRYQRREPVVSE